MGILRAMTHGAFRSILLATVAVAPWTGLAAQDAGSFLTQVLDRRPLAELVEELPGRPIDLNELRGIARERNIPLESARLRRGLAEAGVDISGGDFDLALSVAARFARPSQTEFPSGNYSAGLMQVLPWGTALGVDVTGFSRSRAVVGGGSSYDAGVGLSVSQPLLEGLGTRDTGLKAARFLREASTHHLVRATEATMADVELAYLTLAELEAVEAVLGRSYEIAQALLYRNDQLAARDLVAEVDVVTARSGMAFRRSLLVGARQDRSNAAEALVFLVWGEGASAQLVGDTLPLKTVPIEIVTPEVMDMAEEEAGALERRRDVRAARSELLSAEALLDGARNARLPSLSLDGELRSGGTGGNLGGSLGALDQASSWSIGLTFSQPLRNRRDLGLGRDADLTAELRRLGTVIVENLVRSDVRVAVRGIRAGLERLEAASEASELASAQLEAERRRLDLGLGDSFRLLETEENAVQAELESVRVRYELARAVVRYWLATGREPAKDAG